MRIDGKFRPLLSGFNPSDLDRESGVGYGLWPDLSLAYQNPAWDRFARESGGRDFDRWGLGASLLAAVPMVLVPFYGTHFAAVLRENRPWEHAYECSSPEVERRFHMLSYPLGEGEGLLIIHSLRVEQPHTRPAKPWPTAAYVDADGLVHQCAHCRRVRRAAGAESGAGCRS